jgi:X-linked retinitis pigmentosa GTPase regulator
MDGYTEVFAWGSDSSGQLGLAHKDKGRSYSLPRFCCFNVFIRAISCGTIHSAFIEASGLLYTIGSNSDGRLGVGKKTIGQSKSPCLVEALAHIRVTEVACGGGHTLAVDEQGRAYSWGLGESGALGCGGVETQWAPVEVMLPKGFSALGLAAGQRHSALIGDTEEKTGLLLTFGWGEEGQLGTGRKSREAVPVLIPANEPIKQVSCGVVHTAFVTVFGRVYTMGGNETGQLGLNHRRSVLTPTLVSDLDQVSILKVAAGSHTAALGNDGAVYVWGNSPGIDSLVPSKLQLPRGLVDLSVGLGFGAGIDSTFQVWTWGYNGNGELGLGDFEVRSSPTNVSALHSKKVKTISCGGGFVLALGCDVRSSTKSRICTSTRAPKQAGIDVFSSHITSRPTTPYEPSSVYESVPTSTRDEVRCRPAKSTDIDTFIKRLEARLNLESQLTALVKTNQGQEDRVSETLKLLEEERNRRKTAENDWQRMLSAKESELNKAQDRIKEMENALNTANSSLQLAVQETQSVKREKEELKSSLMALQGGNRDYQSLKSELSQAKCTIDKLEIEIDRREGEVLSLQALSDKLKSDLSSKSQESRRLTQELESANSQLTSRKAHDLQSKAEFEATVEKLTGQLRDSEAALNDAKADIEAIRRGNMVEKQSRSRELAVVKEKEAEMQRMRETLGERDKEMGIIRTELEAKQRKYEKILVDMEDKAVEMERKNREIEEKGRDLAETVRKWESTQQALTILQDKYSELQEQHHRLTRDFALLKDSLQKTEDHNKQLLETLEKRTLTKAREYRERSLNVLNTPSPLRNRSRSPIQDENAGKAVVKPLPLVSPRLVLKEHDLNKAVTPPTFRETGEYTEEAQDKAALQLYRNALFAESES